jgi:septum formation protein
VTRLEGSYFNVMGLPVHRVWEELSRLTGTSLLAD